MRNRLALSAIVTIAAIATMGTSAGAVTTHKRAYHRDPVADVSRTSIQPPPAMIVPVQPYYDATPIPDDGAFDSPWDPYFGLGREPADAVVP